MLSDEDQNCLVIYLNSFFCVTLTDSESETCLKKQT